MDTDLTYVRRCKVLVGIPGSRVRRRANINGTFCTCILVYRLVGPDEARSLGDTPSRNSRQPRRVWPEVPLDIQAPSQIPREVKDVDT